jgi:recombination protein RecA
MTRGLPAIPDLTKRIRVNNLKGEQKANIVSRSATAIREKIESSLAARIPAALSPRLHQAPELLPTGIAEVDALLEGGLPLGSLTEITGPVCSGRSTLVASILAGATQHGASCAYVDVGDALDPLSAAAIGINLKHLLWIRACRTEKAAIGESVDAPTGTPRKASTNSSAQDVYCGSAGRHPRMEVQGMDIAVEKLFRTENSLLRDERIGNPGTTNRTLGAQVDYTPRCSESIRGRSIEQVAMDRQPARRGEVVLHKGIIVPIRSTQSAPSLAVSQNCSTKEIWTSLDRGLRATDLLFNTGGFRVIVLDMGDVRPEQARRIPLASWYRYRVQAEQSQVLFLLLTQTICANSCASVALHCKEALEQWQCATDNHNGESQEGWPLLTGFQYSVSAERKRALREVAYSFGKKPVSGTETSWKRTTLWAR